MKTKGPFLYFAVIILVIGHSSSVRAGTVSGVLGSGVWDGWASFQNDNVNGGNGEDWVGRGEKVNPGWGGQRFDAEYLFYKLDGNTLSLGLQTGFDIITGKVRSGSKDYYAGDMALSFDGTTDYKYALDFGLLTKDYGDHNVSAEGGYHNGNVGDGVDDSGLYSVSKWNTHVIPGFEASNPFAMDGGTIETGFTFDDSGSGLLTNSNGGTDTSFYRQVSFDIGQFRQNDGSLWVDAHWVMSCGNDAINGSIHDEQPVPEPGTIALLGIGLAGLVGVEKRRRRKKKSVDNS